MGRRANYQVVGYRNTDQRASLGDSHVEAAIQEINKLQQRAAATMVHYNVSREATLPMLFSDDDLHKLQQVRGMVKTDSNIKQYDIGQAKLSIDFREALVPAIEHGRLYIQPDRFKPLLETVRQLHGVHLQYEELKGVLRWLNRNATPGAIRFYFPQAMKLCPDSPIWKDLQEVPSRYTNPEGLAAWTQTIKDAANTYAASAMLPSEIGARQRGYMWLTFPREAVHLDMTDPNKLHYSTDEIVYNL